MNREAGTAFIPLFLNVKSLPSAVLSVEIVKCPKFIWSLPWEFQAPARRDIQMGGARQDN